MVVAAPDVQQRLLDIQALDSALDRLAHRRATLPELAVIDTAETRMSALHDERVDAQTALDDAARAQRKVELDVEGVVTRIQRDQQRLDTGAVSTAKELESLQHELGSLARRRGDLEDVLLDHMVAREEFDKRLAATATEMGEVEAVYASAVAARDLAYAEIDRDAAQARADRDRLAEQMPDDLLAVYDKTRASGGGIGAAMLHRGQCQGCHLALSPVELARMKAAPADEVVRCEECRRILVRTPESGLV